MLIRNLFHNDCHAKDLPKIQNTVMRISTTEIITSKCTVSANKNMEFSTHLHLA